ncbi:dihydroxyacetone kinase phosphoryl donor subunit DhaM [Sporolactobacillus putidus]|uniref:phosphoenolpyruvate--glycerone phosphotransferase n=1 Tax=Sporolactobacillus putidus TaxID=492735 RepID=A0A917S1U2_9BACL|nr:dihydroxyacetone kinase phosphoryl donor subunit DhaM [Sporolactobacillus putidus]GGL49390.1 PTS-dependent dihydroxyacetone kinase phosphotransferase subunit DhaM [Sporolactobacillus putidus]
MSDYGVLLVSHVPQIVEGLSILLREVAPDVAITAAGGTDDGGVGTSFDKIQTAVLKNAGESLLAFYDLGSSKMNLDMVAELSDKKIEIFDTAFIEGAYTATALLQAKVPYHEILKQLEPLKVK